MKIAIIGAGAMGGAFAEGLLAAGRFFKPADITVSNPHTDKLRKFEALGANVTTDNRAAVAGADYVAVVVKPWLVQHVIEEIKDVLDYSRQSVICMAASVKSEQLKLWLDKDGSQPAALFIVIPNIAVAVRASMTFVVPVAGSEEQTRRLDDILQSVGQTCITDEAHLSAGTALASCGIAYAMRYVRAASEGGVELGFKADAARDIVLQTVKGAVELLQANGNHPEAEIDKVTTPGGLTIKGLNEMEHSGFTSAVIRGLKAGM